LVGQLAIGFWDSGEGLFSLELQEIIKLSAYTILDQYEKEMSSLKHKGISESRFPEVSIRLSVISVSFVPSRDSIKL